MTAAAVVVWLLNLLTDVVGQLAFKAASVDAGDDDGLAHWLTLLKKKWLWVGIAAYVVEIFTWLALMSLVPLSVAVLLGSINIIGVMIGGRILFAEKITKNRAAAVCLITLGVVCVGLG
jgi:drug/metabolite transporter (DMT)-like permease